MKAYTYKLQNKTLIHYDVQIGFVYIYPTQPLSKGKTQSKQICTFTHPILPTYFYSDKRYDMALVLKDKMILLLPKTKK